MLIYSCCCHVSILEKNEPHLVKQSLMSFAYSVDPDQSVQSDSELAQLPFYENKTKDCYTI